MFSVHSQPEQDFGEILEMKKTLAVAALAAALPFGAQAQSVPGIYIGAEGGLNWMFNSSFTTNIGLPALGLGSTTLGFHQHLVQHRLGGWRHGRIRLCRPACRTRRPVPSKQRHDILGRRGPSGRQRRRQRQRHGQPDDIDGQRLLRLLGRSGLHALCRRRCRRGLYQHHWPVQRQQSAASSAVAATSTTAARSSPTSS